MLGLTWYEALNKYRPQNRQFLLWGGSAAAFAEGSIDETFSAIERLTREGHYSFTTARKPSHFDHVYDFGSLIAILYFPYSTPSGAFHEIYVSGIPLLVPSKSLLIKEFQAGRGMQHHTANNIRCAAPAFADTERKVCDERNSSHDPNACDEDSLYEWLDRADEVQLPFLFSFNSPEHAVRIMQTLSSEPVQNLLRISEGMQNHTAQWIKANTETIHRIVSDAVQTRKW